MLSASTNRPNGTTAQSPANIRFFSDTGHNTPIFFSLQGGFESMHVSYKKNNLSDGKDSAIFADEVLTEVANQMADLLKELNML